MTILNKIYKTMPYCMIRTPIWSKNYHTEKIQDINYFNNLKKSIFKEAILIASNSLYYDFNKIIQGKEKLSLKLKISNEKYINRMSVRSTPFGIFSGINIARFDNQTNLKLCSPKYFKKTSAINMEWLLDFINEIENNICLNYPKTNLIANNLLYTIENKIYLIQSNKFSNKNLSVSSTPLLTYILKITKNGLSVHAIINKISHEFKINDKTQIQKYLQELLNKEILTSCLNTPLINTKDYLNTIIKKLKCIDYNPNILRKLHQINEKIREYNSKLIGYGINNILEITKLLKEIKKSEVQPLKVDMYLKFKEPPSINHNVRSTIENAADIIWYLSRNPVGINYLQKYKNNFIEKYGLNQLVKLQELLNNTIGLGYPEEYSNNKETKIISNKNPLRNNIYMKFLKAIKENNFIKLTDDDIFSMTTEKNIAFAPQSMEIYAEIIAKSQKEIDVNNFQIALNHMNSSLSFGQSFGRFYNNFDEHYKKQINIDIKKINSFYENIEYIELSELPVNKKLANVMNINSSLNFYLNLGINGNISLNDIYVGCNLEYMYFFSKKLNKRLIFTSTSMVNTTILSNLYRFLIDISQEGKKVTDIISFPEIDNFPFTPRILYKNIILRPSKWFINNNIIKIDTNINFDVFKKNFFEYQKKICIPNEFWIVFADNKILLNLTNNDIHIEILYKEFIKQKKIVLTENIYGKFEKNKHTFSSINGSDGYYFGEIVVPVIKNSIENNIIKNIPKNIYDYKSHVNNINDWMFFEITIPKNKQNKFIAYNIKNFITNIEKYLIKWFFIRYLINENNVIRLRINIKNEDISIVYNLFIKWYQQLYLNGIVSYYKLLPYERETFRYGGELSINEVEKFFQSESLFTINLLNIIKYDNDTEKNDILISIFLYQILCSFKIDLNKLLNNQFKINFDTSKIIHKNRNFLVNLVKNNFFNFFNNNDQYYKIIKNYLDQSKKLNFVLDKNITNLTNSKNNIIMSIIHMQCNRIYGIDRKKENFILALLYEIYKIKKYI